MNCDDIRGLFSEYYDGEDSADVVESHLRDCPDCTRAFEEYARLLDEVNALPALALPTGFHDLLMRGVRAESRRKKRIAVMPFVMSAAASFLVVALWFAGAFDFGAADYSFAPAAAPIAMDTPVAATQAAPERFMYDVDVVFPEIAAPAAAAGAVETFEFDLDDFALAVPTPALPPAPADAPIADWNWDAPEAVEVDFERRAFQDVEIFWGNEYGELVEPQEFGFHDGSFIQIEEHIPPIMFRTVEIFEHEPLVWEDVSVVYVQENRVTIWPLLLVLVVIWLLAAVFYCLKKR